MICQGFHVTFKNEGNTEKIAKTLKVEIKDIFEFMHLSNNKKLTENINKLLKEVDEDMQGIILKIIRAVVR